MRVTGGNSLIMTPLNAMEGTVTDATTQNIADLIINAADKTTTASATSDSKEYEEVKSAVSDLNTTLESLLDSSDTSIWAAAEESEDTSDAVTTISDFIEQYNNLMNSLNSLSSDSGTSGYADELTALASNNKEALEKIGITVLSDGTLSIDKDTLSSASLEDLEAVFSGEDSFAQSVQDKSVYIGASVVVNSSLSAASTSYSSSGTAYEQIASLVGSYMDSIG